MNTKTCSYCGRKLDGDIMALIDKIEPYFYCKYRGEYCPGYPVKCEKCSDYCIPYQDLKNALERFKNEY